MSRPDRIFLNVVVVAAASVVWWALGGDVSPAPERAPVPMERPK